MASSPYHRPKSCKRSPLNIYGTHRRTITFLRINSFVPSQVFLSCFSMYAETRQAILAASNAKIMATRNRCDSASGPIMYQRPQIKHTRGVGFTRLNCFSWASTSERDCSIRWGRGTSQRWLPGNTCMGNCCVFQSSFMYHPTETSLSSISI